MVGGRALRRSRVTSIAPGLIWRKISQGASLLHLGHSLGSEKWVTTLRACTIPSTYVEANQATPLLNGGEQRNAAPLHSLSFRPSLRGVLIFFLSLIGGACLVLSIVDNFNMGFFLGAAAAFIALAIHDKLSGEEG
ncbi:unnamed protein product, partial [Clonostachys byssicola]